MKLIDEIIEILSSEKGKLSDALMKTKVLLHKIGHRELVGWVNNEIHGYPEDVPLPHYRILSSQVLANVVNPGWQFKAHPIPLGHLNENNRDFRDDIENSKMNQSLAALEEYAKGDGDLQRVIPMESYGLLEKGLESGCRIQTAWCVIQTPAICQILIQVRSRLLDFVMELSEKLSGDLNDEQVKEQSNQFDATNLFNNTIFGDGATILLGTGNVQHVTSKVTKNDFEALSKILANRGVLEEDLEELKKAIEEDKETVDHEQREYGPAVKGWIQTMFSKAVDGIWQINLGVAGNLLAEALNNYYGWI